MSSSTAAYGGRHGGAGGKFPKKPLLKSHPKPYDRPSQTPNNNNNNNDNNNWWLTKIIDVPNKLYSFVFGEQRRSDEDKEIEDVQPETVANVVDSASNGPVECRGMDHDSCGVTELEDKLKQKVFTRPEIDQLSALLLSRINENLDGAEKEMSGTKLSDQQAVPTSRDKLSSLSAHENNIMRALSGTISTPDMKSKVLPGDVASPAEIAKAYMAGRSTEVSPSVLRLHNQSLDEEVATPSNSLPRSISPAMYLNQKDASYIGNSGNGFLTPRFCGRSVVHNTARTPYSRVHPVLSSKAAETNFCTGGGPSYQNVTENSHYEKQAIKRRRSVLENDIGSVGPIRRIRQKSNLLHPRTLSLPFAGGRQETHVTGLLSDVSEGSYSVEHGFQNRSSPNVLAMHNLPGTSSRFVPSQSIEMAQKIFEHLDKFSPKVMKKPAPESGESLKCSPSSQDMKKTKKSLDNVSEQNNATTETSQIAEEVCRKLDGDVPSKEVALSTSLIEAKQHSESSTKSLAMPDILPLDQTVEVEKAPEMKPTAHSGKTELESVANGCSRFETIVSSPVLPASPANMSMFDVISVPQSTLQSDEVPQQTEKRNFGIAYSSKSDNLLTANSTPLFVDKDAKSETLVSANKVAAQVNAPDKTVNMNTPVCGDAVFKSGDPPSVETLPNTWPLTTSASNTTDNAYDKSKATSSVLNAKPCALSSGGNAIFSLSAPTLESTGGDVQSAGLSSANPFSSIPMTASNSLRNSFTTPLASTSISTTSSIFDLLPQASNPMTAVSWAPSSGLGSSGGAPSTFIFEATSTSASNKAPFIFGRSSGLTASTSIGSSQPSALGSTTFSDNDQITMEDTMAEDSPQLKAPLGGCCLAPSVPSAGFVFKMQQTPVAPQNSLFQPPGGCSGGFGFNPQPSPVVPQNSLFQPSGSSEFIAGTSPNIFSLGTSTDKSQRRIYKPKKGPRRR